MRRGIFVKTAVLAAVLALVAGACTRDEGGQQRGGQTGAQARGSILDQVKQRGTLRCGVNQAVPGFGFLNPDTNEIEGFDIDFCRAVAAAVLGDANRVELVPVTPEERFNALRARQFDVLVRNTTHTSSRDGAEGVAFAHVNFYDGQGMMVREGEFSEVADMTGNPTICLTAGTTTELNLADYFQGLNLEFTPLTFEENPQVQEAFIGGRCDGWTSDKSQLAGIRSEWPEAEGGPESLVILEDTMSKEPLAPAVLDGDSKWYDAVNWTVHGLILAEELGVTSENVDQQAQDPDSAPVAALLGVAFGPAGEEGEPIDSGLGLDIDFMQRVLGAVGNYGEIYDRHVGPDTPLALPRGINALWTDGGIMYAPPFR
ncbi:MAG: amino acid ABC transporter substrate-binding protein [Actinomycetota bacterium]|nr:amino acid ABC transporter substrate-binding protein [Actinomycetota bacterium]